VISQQLIWLFETKKFTNGGGWFIIVSLNKIDEFDREA